MKHVFLPIIIIILSLLLLDPFMVLMPGSLPMLVIIILLAFFIAYSVFFWKEKVKDEREEKIRMFSGRVSWLVGSGVLIIGMVSEGLIKHKVDTWLILALVGMVITKLLTQLYAQKNK